MSSSDRSLLRLSTTAVHGIHALAYLTRGVGPIPAAEIARGLEVALDPLHKVLAKLAKRGWLEASRGPTGGYTLAVSPRTITVLEVVQLLDEHFGAGTCLLPTPSCDRHTSCEMNQLTTEVWALVEARLARMTIVDAGWAEESTTAASG